MRVLVYTDGGLGASEACVSMTIRELRRALTKKAAAGGRRLLSVETTDATAIASGELDEQCRLLVIPGGRDLPYCSLLNGAGNDRIRGFVRGGGAYLGLCAGAYYGASRVEFSAGDPAMEVVGSRELGFYRGVARGPVFPGFSYDSSAGARVCCLSLIKSSGPLQGVAGISGQSSLPVYYNGGCYFSGEVFSGRMDEDLTTDVEVLATYNPSTEATRPSTDQISQSGAPFPDGPALFPDAPAPAVVSMEYGMGRVVLSGVHIESSPASLSGAYSGDPHIESLLHHLRPGERLRQRVFNALIDHLLQ